MISHIKSTALKLTLIIFFTKQHSNHQLAINLNIITPLNIMTKCHLLQADLILVH